MNRLDRYLARNVALMMLLASAGLISLFVIFTFLDQMQDIQNDYTFTMVLSYLGYSIPRMFYETLPYAALIGCLTGLGLLASNSELIVMRAAGISTWQISRAALIPALVLVAIGLLVGELILPDFERTARVVREQAMEDDITPQGGFWYRENDAYMHFAAVSHEGDLKNINQYFVDESGALTRTTWAQSASYTASGNSGSWQLKNVISTYPTAAKSVERFKTLDWDTGLTPQILKTEILVEPDKMSVMELRRKIDYMQDQGLNTGRFELGFWTKAFQPIATLSLVLVAISFIFGPLRETTMGMRVVSGLVVGILFKFVQGLLSPASLVFGFPPLLATLIPISICLGAGYLLLRRAN